MGWSLAAIGCFAFITNLKHTSQVPWPPLLHSVTGPIISYYFDGFWAVSKSEAEVVSLSPTTYGVTLIMLEEWVQYEQPTLAIRASAKLPPQKRAGVTTARPLNSDVGPVKSISFAILRR